MSRISLLWCLVKTGEGIPCNCPSFTFQCGVLLGRAVGQKRLAELTGVLAATGNFAIQLLHAVTTVQKLEKLELKYPHKTGTPLNLRANYFFWHALQMNNTN